VGTDGLFLQSEGAQWVHHKKYTTSPFGERNNKLTWRVALQQAQEMMESWAAADSSAHEFTPNVQEDLFRLALHGFSEAGFGIPMSFRGGNNEGANFASHGFHKALSLICHNLMAHALVMWFLPPFLRPKKHQEAHTTFSHYVTSMVAMRKADGGGNTLLDLLVAAEGLSEEEVMGNLFVFIVAGHETTAGTMYYALMLLALHPEMQSWVRENVDEALGGRGSDVETWKYEEVFPKLGRVLCLMVSPSKYISQHPAPG
jgi:cytochrome P450